MDELKVIGWDCFECEYPCKAMDNKELSRAISVLKEEIINKGYCFSGNDHQYSSTGVPIFSDGTCLKMSMRAWGALMAMVYSDIEGINLSYIDFYMDTFRNKKAPEYVSINVEPMVVENENLGLIIEEDNKLISETLGMGMELMTTDKVLKKYVELLKKEVN